MTRTLITVALLTLLCGLLLWRVNAATATTIAEARQQALYASFAELAEPSQLQSASDLNQWPMRLCGARTLVRAEGSGYGGAIALGLALVPIQPLPGPADTVVPSIAALTVLQHQETPGIGDFINSGQRHSWLLRFIGQTEASFARRESSLDAVSGATITVSGVRSALTQAFANAAATSSLFNRASCP